MGDATGLRIAVLLPCYNEEAAIGQTVAGFRAALSNAAIYVYDNNSTDRTSEVAAAAGAIVRTERMQGKGHVVRRMFADVEADVYVMADGDATSATGIASSSAWTLISVSISKPWDNAGKLLTKRREKTRYPEKMSVKLRPKSPARSPVNNRFPITWPPR